MQARKFLLFLFLFTGHYGYTQTSPFPDGVNTFIIQDDSLKMHQVIETLLQNGYLFTRIDSTIIVTDFKPIERYHQMNIICNKLGGSYYFRASCRYRDSDMGDCTDIVRKGFLFKGDFEYVYRLLLKIKPNINISAARM
ncbi:MAG: hypothetical protein MUE96_06870 [Bacteroidia bacterium]|jgi:hypothetical protein|nr:hypothetical protein [Bacteroidia bacterium]